MRAQEFILETRNSLFAFVKQHFPTWPDYVLKDFLYAQAKGIRDQAELDDFLKRNKQDFGNCKWTLTKLPITFDIFTPKTQRMLASREGGSSNPFQVPRDAERHAQQSQMIQQKGVSSEPIIVAKLANGYDLIEGWHRTIQNLKAFPQGYTGPAWVCTGATYKSEGVAEGVNDYLWHGSKSEHEILYPQQAKDTGGKEESNKNAVYATPSAKTAIAMGLTTPGSDTGMFPNDPQMVLFSGNIRKGQMVYLHKVPKDLFIKHNSREWYSKPGVEAVKPIEVVKVPVDQWLHLIRQATPQDLELRKKYMKEGVAEGKQPGKSVVDAILRVMPIAQEIWFHGSRATGKHRKNSDTDILVTVPDDLVGDQYLAVVRILQKLSAHFDNYDIQPTKSGTNIHRIAQEEGQLLWSTTNENFADGKKPGRKGLAKRSGVNCKQSVTKLRSIAANSSGERQRMAHWCANMKAGRKK